MTELIGEELDSLRRRVVADLGADDADCSRRVGSVVRKIFSLALP
ncbi:hypothetical protein [Amycolatopsis sp. cmx-11-12]